MYCDWNVMSNKKSQECLTIFFFQGGVVKNLVPCLLLTIFFSPMLWYVFPARQWMNFSFKSPLIWQIGVLSTVGGKLAYNLGVAILVHLYGLRPHFLLKIFFDNLIFWNTFLKSCPNLWQIFVLCVTSTTVGILQLHIKIGVQVIFLVYIQPKHL